MADIEKKMELLRQGNISALEQIYLQTKNAVFAIVFSVTKNYHISEELMQETYLKICKNINQYIKGTNANFWINSIAKNLAINAYNRRKFENLTDFGERSDFHIDIDLKIKDESGIFKLMSEILDENEYNIVLMHALGGIKLREIASLLGKPQGTIRWQYNNALKKLKKILKNKEEIL